MSQQRWLVLRCSACNQCSGHRRQGGRCPHCGTTMQTDAEVVKECTSSSMLHLEVALANTPTELQDELRTRLLRSASSNDEPREVSPRVLLRELRSLASEEGHLSRIQVQTLLDERDVEIPADALMEQAEVEGVVVRLSDGRWMFFE